MTKTTTMDYGIQLTDPDFYAGDPHPVYRRLRAECPVHWSEHGQFWAVAKYEDVRRVGQDSRTFSSGRGTLIADAADRDGGGPHMAGAHHLIRSDGTDHTELRRIVSRPFTPAAVSRLEEPTRRIVRDLLAGIDGDATVNAVEALSAPATTYVIAELMGVPQSRWPEFWTWTDAAMYQVDHRGDPERDRQVEDLLAFFEELIAERRQRPGDDIITDLVHGEFRGSPLSSVDLLTFAKLLLTAGTETTRTLVSGGLLLLANHQDQRRALRNDPTMVPAAVEEMLRIVSPVIAFGRTATTDTELGGQRIAEGDYVVQLYQCANRDEDVWDDPEAFDITRPVRRHLAFGHGPHFCLGAPLARMEACVVFEELLARFPHFESVGQPVTRGSTLVRVYEDVPMRFGQPHAA